MYYILYKNTFSREQRQFFTDRNKNAYGLTPKVRSSRDLSEFCNDPQNRILCDTHEKKMQPKKVLWHANDPQHTRPVTRKSQEAWLIYNLQDTENYSLP